MDVAQSLGIRTEDRTECTKVITATDNEQISTLGNFGIHLHYLDRNT
jgi:hypothetical protein